MAPMKACVFVALACLALPGARAAPDKPQKVAPPEPAVEHLVAEDAHVRIEELRVRGATQSTVVRSKIPGVKPYEILPSSAANDPSQPGDAGGQRVWNILHF
ncbi:MAG: hypothetical protein ABT20_05420 [Rubrivivax sp. SCN 70-15]|nr:MAG: hypothetical protein ABT20_05420 [Rubrivivax sp. SCN 70-15]